MSAQLPRVMASETIRLSYLAVAVPDKGKSPKSWCHAMVSPVALPSVCGCMLAGCCEHDHIFASAKVDLDNLAFGVDASELNLASAEYFL